MMTSSLFQNQSIYFFKIASLRVFFVKKEKLQLKIKTQCNHRQVFKSWTTTKWIFMNTLKVGIYGWSEGGEGGGSKFEK